LQQFLTAVAGNPDPSAITIAGGGLVALAVTAWDDLVAQVAGNNPADLQPLLDLLAVKPGATLADVEVIWQALSDGSVAVAQLLSALSGKPLSANPTAADVQAGLPVLIQAIVKDELGDRVTALEAAALSGEGVSQAVVDSLLARLDALEAENVAMKAELAQKIGETDIASLREQAAFAVDETVRLEAQDARIVEWVVEKYLDKEFFERWENSIVDLFSGVYTNHNDLAKLVRDVMDAINGPTATVQSITEMFWLLNDLLMALVEATGIDFPGSK
jgi:parvulin-like peptidyl-prolyl isomerase